MREEVLVQKYQVFALMISFLVLYSQYNFIWVKPIYNPPLKGMRAESFFKICVYLILLRKASVLEWQTSSFQVRVPRGVRVQVPSLVKRSYRNKGNKAKLYSPYSSLSRVPSNFEVRGASFSSTTFSLLRRRSESPLPTFFKQGGARNNKDFFQINIVNDRQHSQYNGQYIRLRNDTCWFDSSRVLIQKLFLHRGDQLKGRAPFLHDGCIGSSPVFLNF